MKHLHNSSRCNSYHDSALAAAWFALNIRYINNNNNKIIYSQIQEAEWQPIGWALAAPLTLKLNKCR
jgi:hypothetical protein